MESDPALDRARKAVAQTLKGVAWDVSNVSESHPIRQSNEMLNLQITDVVEVVEKHLASKLAFLFLICASYS
jgi:hypothetical protein